MKPADVCLAVLVAVIWGLAFVASRIALDELSPALMTTLRFAIAAVPCLFVRKPECLLAAADRDQRHAVSRPVPGAGLGIAHGVPVGLSSVIVQSQALFTIAFAAIAFREMPTPHADRRHRRRDDRPADDLRHRRLRFQRRRLRGADDLAGQFRDRQSAAAAGAGRADVRPVRLALPGAAAAAAGAGACHRRAAGDLARAVRRCRRPAGLHAVRRRDLHQHRLLAVGPAAAGLHRRAGGAVRAAGAVRRRRGVEHRVRRNLRAAAAGRHGHRGRRHRRHAAVEAAARRCRRSRECRAPCRTRC